MLDLLCTAAHYGSGIEPAIEPTIGELGLTAAMPASLASLTAKCAKNMADRAAANRKRAAADDADASSGRPAKAPAAPVLGAGFGGAGLGAAGSLARIRQQAAAGARA